jgi:hypothetical protein
MKAPHFLSLLTFTLATTALAPVSVQAYYNPSTGRWLSRDPIAGELNSTTALDGHPCQPSKSPHFWTTCGSQPIREQDLRAEFWNEYAFVRNSPLIRFDLLGLMGCTRRPCCIVWWDAENAMPVSHKCVYTAVIGKVGPLATPDYPSGCCPKIGTGTPYGKNTVFLVYDPNPCLPDTELPALIRVRMFSPRDPPNGIQFNR